ncbi:TPA: DUF551 domain-containing protein [Enterobacter hormaechei]
MSNIDKQAVQAVADLKAGYTLGHADVAILNELARIALASLEAEAVAWLYSASFERGHVEGELTDAPGCDMPVYTAPPAPVSVPAAIHSQGEKSVGDDYYALGWNACRAAMLQGAEHVSNRDELPECWVACSERMPDDEEDVLCFGQYGDNDIDEERYQFMGWLSSKGIKRVWRVSDGDSQNRRARVTHWMPLPAAPQQEAKNV